MVPKPHACGWHDYVNMDMDVIQMKYDVCIIFSYKEIKIGQSNFELTFNGLICNGNGLSQ